MDALPLWHGRPQHRCHRCVSFDISEAQLGFPIGMGLRASHCRDRTRECGRSSSQSLSRSLVTASRARKP